MEVFGTKVTITLLLSLWGAVLSSVLATFKLIEYWNNRFKIRVSTILRGCVDTGHDISIQNLSPKPVLLESMELYLKDGNQKKHIWSPEDSFLNIRIEPFDTKLYNFNQAEYFPWKNGVYVKLYFAGKSPIIKSVT